MLPGSCGSNSTFSAWLALVEELPGRVGQLGGPLVLADPRDGRGQRGDRVVAVDHASVAGGAGRGQPHPGEALLGRLHGVDPLVADGDAEPADLADRLGHALEQVRMLLDEEFGTPVAARLLVGGEGEHDVAVRLAPLAHPLPDDREDHRVHVLHVDRAAPPHAAVGDLARERVTAPVERVGRHDVQVTVNEQCGAAPVVPFHAGDEAGPLRVRLEDGGLQPDLAQQARHVLGGPPFARAGVVPRVGRVDPDQVSADVDDLILSLGSEVLSHAPILAPPGAALQLLDAWGCVPARRSLDPLRIVGRSLLS